MIGQSLDRYRIDSKLGEGGMGVVYKAYDTHLDRSVAIKVLPHDKVSDLDRKQRFVQEAKAASALNHANIITVHDIRSHAGIDFIVMEYASGRTLDQIIQPRGLSVAQTLRYGVQMADALATAHDAGIVHRDLKPSNVMVTDDDRVKILDFGLAKLLEPAAIAAEVKTRTSSLTDPGVVLGTAAYMSPEQAEGRRVDARSDVFSFGAVLYEMVTGRRPFTGDSPLAVLAKILNEDPAPPSTLTPLPPEVERPILRCLRKDPARRYQTMADLKVALEDLAAEIASGPQTPAPAGRVGRAWLWPIAALAAVVLVAAYVWTARPAPASLTPLVAAPLTSLPGTTRSPSFSPDGNHVAFSWTGVDDNNLDVYVQQIGAGTPLRLTSSPLNEYGPMWSPDGRWIAFLRGEGDSRSYELRLVPPLGGPERLVAEVHPRGFLRPVSLTWCPGSECVVVIDSLGDARPDALFVVSLESGEKRQLTHPDASVFADTDPALSPDGRWLAFRREVSPFAGELLVLPLAADLTAAGEPRTIAPLSLYAYTPGWMPDSSEVVFSARAALWRVKVAGDRPPERLPFVGEDGLTPIVSRSRPDGSARLAYVRSFTDSNIWRVDTSSAGEPAAALPRVAISSNRRDAIPHVSPDGRQVVFVSNRSGENEIWRSDVSGAGAVQLTSMGLNPGWPRWSPDGQLIAFHSNGENGSGDIFVVASEGGRPRNLTAHPSTEAFASFSRDGRFVYFSSGRTGRPLIWKQPVAGGVAAQVTTDRGVMAIESFDGTHLYYTEATSANTPSVLWRVSVAGGPALKILDGVVSTSFDVLDRGIYFIERLPDQTRLQFFDIASGHSTTVAANLTNLEFGLGASPDGRTIFFTRTDASLNDLMLVDKFR